MDHRGVHAFAASAAPACAERHPARPPLERRARPIRRRVAAVRRPLRPAPTAQVRVPTPTPPRRPTRPYLPGGQSRRTPLFRLLTPRAVASNASTPAYRRGSTVVISARRPL